MSNLSMECSRERQEWAEAADKAKEAATCASEGAGHAASAIAAMAGRAACDVGRRVDDLTANAGASIQSLGDQIGRSTPHSGMLGDASQAVAQSVRDSGEYLQTAKLSGLTEDIATVVRRNPIPAVLIALGLGWCMGRRVGS